MTEPERITGLFRENGFVFSLTVDPENFMLLAISSDSASHDGMYRDMVARRYPFIAGTPELVKAVSLREDAECAVVDGYMKSKAVRTRAIDVTLDPDAFDIRLVRDSRMQYGERLVVTTKRAVWRTPYEAGPFERCESGEVGFVASFPSEKAMTEAGVRDFILVQHSLNGFWRGSRALDAGFALVLAPDVETYEAIFDAETKRLRSLS